MNDVAAELTNVLQALADGNATVREMAHRVAEANRDLAARVLDVEQRQARRDGGGPSFHAGGRGGPSWGQ